MRGISTVKYAVKRNKNNHFLTVDQEPNYWRNDFVVAEHHLYSSRWDAIDFIQWLHDWAEYPASGPKVSMDANETFSIVRVRMDLRVTTTEQYPPA